MMQSYFLAPHVYPCVTEDHVVLLDLARDQYIGVARDQMAALAARVKGWPGLSIPQPEPGDVRSSNPRATAMLEKMLAAGMLTTDPAVGKEARPLQMPAVSAPLVEPELEWRPRITLADVVGFLYASASTALAMRFLPIQRVVDALARRKQKAVANGIRFDPATARRATAAFIYLRPLVFGAQDACLYDSLALARFLAGYKQFPTCVIGVQTGPFGAHCWVQEGDVVFNDSPEYVRRFTPILAV